MGILFTGDWHWDCAISGKSRNDEILDGIKQVIAVAKEKDCKDLFIVGDIMDSPRYKGPDPLSGFASMINFIYTELPGVHIYLLKGNHDWDGLPAIGRFRPDDFTVINTPSVVSFEDADILAVPYMRNIQLCGKSYGDILEELGQQTDRTKIAAIHAALEVTRVGETEATVPVDALKRCGAKYGILGHIHKHNSPAKDWYYTGSLIRCTFGEEGERSGVYYYSDGELEDIPIQAREVINLRYNSVDDAKENLQKDIESAYQKYSAPMIKVNVPGAGAMSDVIEEAGKTATDKYKSKAANDKNNENNIPQIVKYDYSAERNPKQEEKEITFGSDSEKESDAPLLTSMQSRLSVKNLWVEYCDKNRDKYGLEDKDKIAIIVALGKSILGSNSAQTLWSLMKSGNLPDLIKLESDKDNPLVKLKEEAGTKTSDETANDDEGGAQGQVSTAASTGDKQNITASLASDDELLFDPFDDKFSFDIMDDLD